MDLIERLRQHEDTVRFTWMGGERYWLLGRRAFRLAKAQGVELSDILGDVDAATSTDAAENLDQFARLLWCGLLPFEPDATLDDVADMLSLADVTRLQPLLTKQFQAATEEVKGSKKKQGEN